MCIARLFRRWLLLLAPAVALLTGAAPPLAAQGSQEMRSLQQRLTDAKCYSGPIDGAMNPSVVDAIRRCPDTDPVLSIETGMHVSAIYRVSADRSCRLAVTGSDDKTVRLWSLPDGQLLRTLRVPIGRGDYGKVFAVAMSPDGRTIAAGGYDAYWERKNTTAVYLFDAANGALTARLGAIESSIDHLTFSADGRYLAAMLGQRGMRVFDVGNGAEVGVDKNYAGAGTGAVFTRDGRLFTVSADGWIRSYDRNFRLTRKTPTRGGRLPFSIAADGAGENLAVGFSDSKAVEIYRASDLGFIFAADTSGIEGGNLGNVAWSRSGNLVAAGAHKGSSGMSIFAWEDGGHGRRSEAALGQNTVMNVEPCGEGFLAATFDPLWAALDASGHVALSRTSVAVDTRNKFGDAFQVSRDGTKLRFGLGFGGTSPVLFDLNAATLTANGTAGDLAERRLDGIPLTDWQGGRIPKLGGQPIRLDEHEVLRSVAAAPDASVSVLGSDYALRAFDRNGRELWKRPSVTAWGVNVTGDGRIVVAAFSDGTIRWHRMSDGQELLALFVDKDDKRWVAWTPSGYYQASAGGEDLFGWQVNRGWNQAADFFPASRFRDRFGRPDIVQKILLTLDEGSAIEQANREANLRTDTSSVASRLPPVVRILSPTMGTGFESEEVTVEYELRSPSGLPVDTIEVQIDGRPTRGLERVTSKLDGTLVERRSIAIPPRDVTIGLVARSGTLASDVASVQLKWAGGAGPNGDGASKPKLYGLLVGVSTYKDSAINLHYAAKDARDFAEALMAQKGGLYREIELKVLTDAEATTAEVKKGLGWLERSVTSRDVGLVFFAGHGITDAKNRYYYLTADSDPRDPEDSALEGLILRDRTRSIAGKVLVFLDTCHAGQAMVATSRSIADINGVVSELSSTENGIVTFASSTGRQLSQENDSWHNGAFTKALIEGLPAAGRAGKADLANKGVVTTATLDFWLSERVRELTGGAQSPVMSRPPTIPDFPLFAAVR
jgi:WD40 repeat protein